MQDWSHSLLGCNAIHRIMLLEKRNLLRPFSKIIGNPWPFGKKYIMRLGHSSMTQKWNACLKWEEMILQNWNIQLSMECLWQHVCQKGPSLWLQKWIFHRGMYHLMHHFHWNSSWPVNKYLCCNIHCILSLAFFFFYPFPKTENLLERVILNCLKMCRALWWQYRNNFWKMISN